MANNVAATSSLGFSTRSSINIESICLCEVDKDTESVGSEDDELEAMLASVGDDDGSCVELSLNNCMGCE